MTLRDRWAAIIDRILLTWENAALAGGDAWRHARPLRSLLAAQAARTRSHPLAWGTAYAWLFCAVSFAALDRPLAWWFKAHVGGEFEGFLKTVTTLGLGGVYLIPAGLLALALWLASAAAPALGDRLRLRRGAVIAGFVFASVAVSGIAGNVIKFVLGRYRPRYLFDNGLYGFTFLNHTWAMNSFPSGHSQAAFAAMTALTLVFPRYDIAFFAVAVLVAASRFLTTVHFLSDTVAGAWLGIVVTVLIHRFLLAKGIDVRVRLERDRRLAE
jgi:membrane-associated phospholipid phosphatase